MSMLKAPNVTAGEWEVVPRLNVKWNSPDKIESVVYEICGGEKSGPFENKGLFHPSDATYYIYEHTVAAAELWEGTWHCGGIENKADAKMLAASKKLAKALAEAVRIESSELIGLEYKQAITKWRVQARDALLAAGYEEQP